MAGIRELLSRAGEWVLLGPRGHSDSDRHLTELILHCSDHFWGCVVLYICHSWRKHNDGFRTMNTLTLKKIYQEIEAHEWVHAFKNKRHVSK